MKVALAQINPIIGDFSHNLSRITKWTRIAKERGCALVIFPELAISGYPPLDMLERRSFLDDHDAAVRRLVAAEHGIGIICGTIERRQSPIGKPLHNCVILFENGEILFTARKRLLPTYDVFDETRYFEPGPACTPCHYQGLTLGLTVCEDIWNDPAFFAQARYPADPLAELAAAAPDGRLDLLVNVAASPFHMGKYRSRQEMLASACRRHKVPLIYVNQVGGQDSLLFDGRSLAFDAAGRVVARAVDFEEDLVVFDLPSGAGELRECIQNGGESEAAAVHEALVLGTRDYVGKCGFGKGVVGLSGGIDSAVTAAIACRALGPENVMGVGLPSPYTSEESLTDAQALAANLAMRFEIIPIHNVFGAYLDTLAPLLGALAHDLTEQNIQARIRGNILMAFSNRLGHLLLSTGNKSEMAVGYCTLYGDMSGGLAVISDVPKGLVYQLAAYSNRDREIIPQRIIDRPPTAELKPDQRDQDDLPPYDVLDSILKLYLEDNLAVREIIDRGFEETIVRDVVRRVRLSEYKRKQAPLGLKVTTKAFGQGRRYPTAERYRES